MRFVLVMLALLTAPVLAQAWDYYENARFGYSLNIPPDFIGYGESDNGDGQSFSRLEAEQTLLVWGGLTEDLASEVATRMASEQGGGWGITDQTQTPQWAYFVGERDHRLFYQRVIVLCDGNSYAAFRFEYHIRDLNRAAHILEGLVQSFVARGC